MTRDEAKQASYVHMCTVHLILLEVLKVAFTASSVPPMIRLVPVGARLIFAEEFLTPLSAHTHQADPRLRICQLVYIDRCIDTL